MGTQQIEQSQEDLVEDVEQELRERKEEAAKRVEKAEEKYSDQKPLFRSPPIFGGQLKEKHREDVIRLKLDEELPNGTERFSIPMPSESEIEDDNHELNRLLSLYDIEADKIADISGERLPIVPVGDYSNPEKLRYELDVPPVNAGANMLRYKIRRTGMKLRLIERATTPSVRTDVFGDLDEVKFRDNSSYYNQSPIMAKSAKNLFSQFYMLGIWESEQEYYLPTNRGMKVIVGLIHMAFVLAPIVTGSYFVLLLCALLMIMNLALFPDAHAIWVENTFKMVKNTVFPNYS